ncbi:hypothetical protein Tsubulata_032898 [Turnera subulata]|uniref:ENTH domain-containing protein n=1 Tax=Turnera subulata TaxID=218843 RepID=A0A9Q0FCS5_9ROSI|nr:hypothetical protein Tsubulata_032898 [Turnera subulata]
MRLWQRAAGAIKDQKSILVASLSGKSSFRNPYIEAAIIKATSHDERNVDYKNAQRVFSWIRTSPVSLKPLIFGLTTRMEKTGSWVVALKGLLLMHGVFCCNTPAVQNISCLPFDLSDFKDGHSSSLEMWGYNAFVRSYFVFLDRRCTLLSSPSPSPSTKQTDRRHPPPPPRQMQELRRLNNFQALLDSLLQIKPLAPNMTDSPLILEAMDCLIVEVFDVYGRICNGIARVLMGIHSAGKREASMAVKILKKATTQAQDLADYFEFCRGFGVINAKEIPDITRIAQVDIRDLERVMTGIPGHKKIDDIDDASINEQQDHMSDDDFARTTTTEPTKSSVVEVEVKGLSSKSSCTTLTTVITDKWEVFEDHEQDLKLLQLPAVHAYAGNPFLINQPTSYLPIVPLVNYKQDTIEIPDLITF